jgi:hypothetical protein
MARSKQVAEKSSGRQKIAKQSARTMKAPVKKARTSKSKGYVSPSNGRADRYQIGVSLDERNLVDDRKSFAGYSWPEVTRTSWIGSGDMMEADTRYHRSGKSELKDANADSIITLNSSSSAVVQSPRSVRGSYDQAPK